MEGSGLQDEVLLRSRVRVPEHVVYRDFGDETVALNLDSGKYHGLNGTAATMLTAVGKCESVGDAVGQLAEQFEQPTEVIERDLLDLCRALSERGLIQLDGGGPG